MTLGGASGDYVTFTQPCDGPVTTPRTGVFDSQSGSAVASQNVVAGKTAVKPAISCLVKGVD